jgi:hypothetical protein
MGGVFANNNTPMKTTTSLLIAISMAVPAFAEHQKSFTIRGEFIDSCSCAVGCSCPMGVIESGCQGIGVIVVKSGKFAGDDLSGTRIAYAVSPGKWVRGYVDAPTPAKEHAAAGFAASALAGFGKVEFIKPAHISVSGSNGNYTYSVNDGRIMTCSTKMVAGGDGRSPIVHANLPDPLNDKFAQAKTVSGTYHDGARAFKLKASNSYYNNQLNKSGKL